MAAGASWRRRSASRFWDALAFASIVAAARLPLRVLRGGPQSRLLKPLYGRDGGRRTRPADEDMMFVHQLASLRDLPQRSKLGLVCWARTAVWLGTSWLVGSWFTTRHVRAVGSRFHFSGGGPCACEKCPVGTTCQILHTGWSQAARPLGPAQFSSLVWRRRAAAREPAWQWSACAGVGSRRASRLRDVSHASHARLSAQMDDDRFWHRRLPSS